jgi:hypothetical protein
MMGWGCAAFLAAIIAVWGQGLAFPAGLTAATVSLAIAHRGIPRGPGAGLLRRPPNSWHRDIPLRAAATVALILALTAAVDTLGSLIGGVLTALPTLASVLAVFTHRDEGPHAVAMLLRGMIVGMAGFVGFCAVVAVMVVPVGAPTAFGAAAVGAVVLQAAALGCRAQLTRRLSWRW